MLGSIELHDTIMESRDETFFENMFPMKDMHSISRFSSEIIPEPIAPIESSEQPHENVLEKDDSEAPRRSKRQRIEKSFAMISLCTLWMILPRLLLRHMHLQMQMIGKKLSVVRWTQFFQMGLGR